MDDGGAVQQEYDPPNPIVVMHGILDKLKILNYESDFADEQMNGMLLHAAYFAVPHPKPNEQFFYFTSLFAWLMRRCGFKFQRPDQFDDPNSTVANVVDALRGARIPVDYAAGKFKQGYGEAVVVVLNMLCDLALERAGFRVAPPVFPSDNYEDQAPAGEDEEVSADIADTVAAVEEDEEDEEDMYVRKPAAGGAAQAGGAMDASLGRPIESQTDPNAWRIEVENVAPMLKMRAEADNKEWRTHLESTKELQGSIEGKVPNTKEHLDKLSKGINGDMEQISTREKHINAQYKELVLSYQEVQDGLQKTTNDYETHNAAVSEVKDQLAQISEELEQIRSQMDERGESMTDTGPLVRIKDAMKKAHARARQVSHNLLHIKMHTDTSKARSNNDEDEDEDEDED